LERGRVPQNHSLGGGDYCVRPDSTLVCYGDFIAMLTLLRPSVCRSMFVCAGFASMYAPSVQAQVHPDVLTSQLKGKDVTSLVVIGDKGAPAGYNAPYPVNTLAYPDGQIVYRVEWAMMRGEVGRMEKSFSSGSTFEVSSVDLKDDRLEIKLTARDRDSGRLKLMLGSQWQSKMTDSAVFEALSRFLQLPVEASSLAGPPNQPSTREAATIAQTIRTTPQLSYQRATNAADLPQRMSASEVNQDLKSLYDEAASSQGDVARYSLSTSRGLQAFEAVYKGRRDFGAENLVDLISAKQAELGVQLIPRSDSDIEALDSLFKKCTYMARMRQQEDGLGREVGPGGNNPDYVRSFLKPAESGTRSQDVQQLVAALRRTAVLDSLAQVIVNTETNLDSANFQQAEAGYSDLQMRTATSASVSAYLQQSAALRADVDSLLRAKQVGSVQQASVSDLVGTISKLESLESEASNKPLTRKYLDSTVAEDKARLSQLVSALPTFHYPDSRSTVTTNHLTEAQAGVRAAELSDSLKEAAPLVAVVGDADTMNKLHAWFGDSLYESLVKKAQGAQKASNEYAAMNARIEALRTAARQAEDERRAAAEARANAAGNIVNTALIITKLDEQFRQTEVMGYSMEAQKQRITYANLIRSYRAPDVWIQVQARFQQVLPGLTVWEANHAQAILAEARP
jgi:hypothetical protein